ncbi:hypothetical protein TNCV_681111 [Trichonephila clavipes]|nr:hypothetical protein TNCV_681111 [Trichonephila clavipes]
MRCFPFETEIYYRGSPTSPPEENTSMPYSGFQLKATGLQAESYIPHTGLVAINLLSFPKGTKESFQSPRQVGLLDVGLSLAP